MSLYFSALDLTSLYFGLHPHSFLKVKTTVSSADTVSSTDMIFIAGAAADVTGDPRFATRTHFIHESKDDMTSQTGGD